MSNMSLPPYRLSVIAALKEKFSAKKSKSYEKVIYTMCKKLSEEVYEEPVDQIYRYYAYEKVGQFMTDPPNEILKDLNRVIKDLFNEFDPKDLDQVDVSYIRNEFNLTLSEAQDMIDPMVENFADSEIAKIEAKIDLMYKKLERFIS